jgi:hypothetical protein
MGGAMTSVGKQVGRYADQLASEFGKTDNLIVRAELARLTKPEIALSSFEIGIQNYLTSKLGLAYNKDASGDVLQDHLIKLVYEYCRSQDVKLDDLALQPTVLRAVAIYITPSAYDHLYLSLIRSGALKRLRNDAGNGKSFSRLTHAVNYEDSRLGRGLERLEWFTVRRDEVGDCMSLGSDQVTLPPPKLDATSTDKGEGDSPPGPESPKAVLSQELQEIPLVRQTAVVEHVPVSTIPDSRTQGRPNHAQIKTITRVVAKGKSHTPPGSVPPHARKRRRTGKHRSTRPRQGGPKQC